MKKLVLNQESTRLTAKVEKCEKMVEMAYLEHNTDCSIIKNQHLQSFLKRKDKQSSRPSPLLKWQYMFVKYSSIVAVTEQYTIFVKQWNGPSSLEHTLTQYLKLVNILTADCLFRYTKSRSLTVLMQVNPKRRKTLNF